MLPISLLLVPPLHYREVKCCPNFRRWCRRYAADFTAVGAALLHYREGLCCPNFRRWCRRYAADFTAVGCCYYSTGWVYAAEILPVGGGGMLPILLLLVLLLHYG